MNTRNSLTHDLNVMSEQELAEQYGIEFMEDGSVYDPIDNKTFPDKYEWAAYVAEFDNEQESFTKFGSHAWDDDY